MKILDTNLLINLLDGEKNATQFIEEMGVEETSTTFLNAYELLKEPQIVSNQEALKDVKGLLTNLEIIKPGKKTAETASKLNKELRDKRKKIPEFDLLIASTAITKNLPLVSNDKHMEKINQLKLEKY